MVISHEIKQQVESFFNPYVARLQLYPHKLIGDKKEFIEALIFKSCPLVDSNIRCEEFSPRIYRKTHGCQSCKHNQIDPQTYKYRCILNEHRFESWQNIIQNCHDHLSSILRFLTIEYYLDYDNKYHGESKCKI